MKDVISNYLKNSKVVIEFDSEKKKVKYDLIKQYRDIKSITGKEEIVRAYLLDKLIKELGYLPENIEIEKEYDIGRPKVNKPRIDIIVKDKNNDDAFLFIEVKDGSKWEEEKEEAIEKQLFNLAGSEVALGNKVKYLVYYAFDIINDEIKDKCVIIDYSKYSSYKDWKEERNFSDTLPARYNKAQKEPYKKGGKKDLETNFSHEQINQLGRNLHNVLWGGGGTDDNEVFSSLVNIILAKIQDESEKKEGEQYEFQNLSFDKDKDEFETKENLFDRINGLYKRALKERLNILDEKRLAKSFVVDENKFNLSKLKYTVGELERYSFVDGKNSLTGKDILGDFFESIIRDGFKQTKGQFFTHIKIVEFILWAMQLDKLAIHAINKNKKIPYLIDPSCGSGTFLIEYMKFITSNIKTRFNDKVHKTRDIEDNFYNWFLPDHRENKWAKEFIYGVEHNFNLGTAVKVNMILHGDGSSNIFVKDGLLPFSLYSKETSPNVLNKYEVDNVYKDKNINNEFDVIITNPPFSVDLDKDTKESISSSFVFGEKKNSENLFIERYYQLLRENGRLGVVLPESVFDTTENKYIRLFIFKYFNVKAVVSLPQVAFEPFTSTKTSLLFAQKKTKTEIRQYQDLWDKYSNEWSLLKTRCEKEIELLDGKKMNNQWAIAKESDEKRKQNVIRLLKNHIEENEKNLSLAEIALKYKQEITDLCKYDKDTTDMFGFVNAWWVFGEVAKEMNYKIFMAEAENVGYKRTKRGEKPMPNDLFRAEYNNYGKITKMLLSDEDGIYETILDEMRKIEWN